MKECGDSFKIPIELQGEDVYDILFIFDNEEEAIKYICEHYDVDMDEFVKELHEEDLLREEYGKDNNLRSASVLCDVYLKELLNGEYILWMAY